MGQRHKLYVMLLRKKDGSVQGFLRRVEHDSFGAMVLVSTFSKTRISVYARPPSEYMGWNKILRRFNGLSTVDKGDEIFISRVNSKKCPIKIVRDKGGDGRHLPSFKFIQTDGRNPPTAI